MQKNLESLGFGLTEALATHLQTLPLDRLVTLYKSLVKDLRELVGAHREFRPLYPGFPEQVMSLSEAELYLNALLHYAVGVRPPATGEPRPALTDQPPLRVIELGTREDFEQIFVQLLRSRTSLSAQDKQDITWFVAQYRDDIVRLLPDDVPMKENIAVVGAELIRHASAGKNWLDARMKTATDVLRLAVALSGGDVSLAEPVKFAKFRRAERKLLLGWVERTENPTEDMLRWKERWKRLGERLHPGEYAAEFPQSFAAFDVLRNDRHFETFNAQVERRLSSRDTAGALSVLIHRPGTLARRLDHLLRTSNEPAAVLAEFAKVVDQVSTRVLLQMLAHFRHRAEPRTLRTFFPKGDVAKVYGTPDRLPRLSAETVETAVALLRRVLVERFSSRPRLGRCYLDPRLKDYLVPFSQRSASKALRTLVRGSRLPMPGTGVVRFFLWWKNGSSRTDIDLSAVLFGPDYRYIDALSYYNLKNFGGHHSGDIVAAPRGAAEFIDIDVNRTINAGVRFVVMALNSFTEQPYCDLPECFAGWMGRREANSGEVFEPRTVEDKVDLAANTRICIPAVFDLVQRQVLWADVALRSQPRWNNVRNNLSGVSLLLRTLTTLDKMNLHELFSLHIEARGESVSDPGSADVVFAGDQGITPFDLTRIAADFL